jgi:hypothetical protein
VEPSRGEIYNTGECHDRDPPPSGRRDVDDPERAQEHPHNGVAAPDCLMHHQAPTDSGPAADHSHHGHASSSDDTSTGGVQVSCHCGNAQLADLIIGRPAILRPASSHAPFVSAVRLDPVGDLQARSLRASPPSPPPR